MIRVMIGIPEGSLRRVYWVQFWHLVTRRRNASAAKVYALKCAFHYHMHRMVLALIAQDRAPINTF
jgi:hypothetical protein